MKKVLAIVLCVCLALTLSVSAMAAGSPENNVIVRKGDASKQTGDTSASFPVDTFVEVAPDNTVTVVANEKTYGTFNSWSIYVLSNVAGTSGALKATAAKAGVDYTVVSGNLKSKTLVIKSINRLAVCGNYGGTITDPLSASTVPGTKPDKSPKHGDLNVMYIAIAMLAAGAVLFGAKRQLSK